MRFYVCCAGEVAPWGVAVFNWLFQPLEAKAYSAALPLTLGALPPQPLLIHGRGYHPTQDPQQAALTAEEEAQYVSLLKPAVVLYFQCTCSYCGVDTVPLHPALQNASCPHCVRVG